MPPQVLIVGVVPYYTAYLGAATIILSTVGVIWLASADSSTAAAAAVAAGSGRVALAGRLQLAAQQLLNHDQAAQAAAFSAAQPAGKGTGGAAELGGDDSPLIFEFEQERLRSQQQQPSPWQSSPSPPSPPDWLRYSGDSADVAPQALTRHAAVPPPASAACCGAPPRHT